MPSGLVPGAGLSKDEVDYRQHEKCASCVYFYPTNSCERVAGNISSENVCDLWEVKQKTRGKDANFYNAEFDKAQRKSAGESPARL